MRAKQCGVVWFVAVAAMAGCDPAPTVAPTDGGADLGADAPATDVSRDAWTPTDAPVDAPVDAGPRCPTLPEQPAEQTGALCDEANVTDITDRVAAGRHFIGWVNAPRRPTSQVMNDGCSLRGGELPLRELVLRYRMRATSRLRVSTDHLGSYCGPEGLKDTFVGLYRACGVGAAEPRGAAALGCASDVIFDGAGPATVLSNGAIPAGELVYIVVGTFARGTSAPPIAPYELSVDEVAEPRTDDPCLPEFLFGGCPAEHTCVAPSQYSNQGRCRRDGTAAQTPCRPATDAGATDAAVDASADASADAETLDGDASGDGAVDAPGATVDNRCDPGLRCISFTSGAAVCYAPREYGESCDGEAAVCRRFTYWNCIREPRDPTTGTCRQDGLSAGARCGTDRSAPCPAGLTCSGETNAATCRATSAVDQPCDPFGLTSACGAGLSCVRSTSAPFTCRPDGSTAGAACREESPRCDSGLSCSSESGPGRCAQTLAAGATACDPRYGSTRCPTGQACLATGFETGRCVAVTPESDADNNHPLLAQPVTLPIVIRGGLPLSGDVDCFAFDLPEGAAISAETSNGAGWCAGDEDTVITVRDLENRVIEGNDDHISFHVCSRVDGTWTNTPLRSLAAGRYAVCVASFRGEAPIGEYFLALAAGAR